MDVSAIERAAAIAWPAAETEMLGEWVLSAGDGFSRRRNSAVPVGPSPRDPEERINQAAGWYRERGVTPRFRITPECDPAIDEMLDRLGYAYETPTLVMGRSLDWPEASGEIVESSVVTDMWIEAELDAFRIDRSLVGPWLATVESVPPPRVFVTAIRDGAAVGAGFGVVVDGLLISFEVAVAEGHRRQGYATSLMAALHAFGVRESAQQAILQVMEESRGAFALYGRLGYETAYPYWYRRLDA